MIELGPTLREARERKRLTLADAERATRIRARYLHALEAERFDRLPGDAYAKSFLREYAELLGLDGGLLAAEFDARFAAPEPVPAPRPLAARRRPSRALSALVLLGVAAGVAVAVWSAAGGKAPRQRLASPLAPAAAPRHPVRQRPQPPARPVVHHLVLTASRGDCWVAVHAGSATGPVLYESMLRSGASLAYTRRFLWIRMGAPWNVDARLDGKPLAVPPSSGTPIDVQFALDSLRIAQ